MPVPVGDSYGRDVGTLSKTLGQIRSRVEDAGPAVGGPWRRLAPLVVATGAAQSLLVILGPTVVAIAAEFDVSVGVAAQSRSITAGVAVVTSLALTQRIDRLGIRRLLSWGALAAIVACAAIAVAPVLAVYLTSHIVLGVGFACLVSAGFAGVASFEREKRAWAMGYVSAAIAGAWIVVNPVVGILTESISWRIASLAPASIALLVIWMAKGTPARDGGGEVGSMRHLLESRSARRWMIAELLYYTAWATFLTFSGAFFIEALGLGESTVGWMLAIGPAAFFASATQSRALVARFDRARLVAAMALTIGALLVVLLVLTRSIIPAAALNALIGVAAGVRTPVSSNLGMAQIPDQPGAMMSVRTGVNQLGYLVGGLVGGSVIAVWGYPALGLALGVILAVAALLYLRVRDSASRRPTARGNGQSPRRLVELGGTGT